jgi:hypothetical protein
MTADKRQSARSTVHTVIDIMDLATDSVIGQLVNISEGGFMLRAHVELPVNRLYQLKMAYADAENRIIKMEFGAESLWGQEMADSGLFWYGFQIIDISDETIQRIQELTEMWES